MEVYVHAVRLALQPFRRRQGNSPGERKPKAGEQARLCFILFSFPRRLPYPTATGRSLSFARIISGSLPRPCLMDAPNLVVVPPTPQYSPHSYTPAGYQPRTAPPTPELVQTSSIDQERSSSETTIDIVTIYSMYGEDAASPPTDTPLKQSGNGSSPFPTFADDGLQIQNTHSGTSYYSASSDSRPPSKRSTPIGRISTTVSQSPGRDSTSSDASSIYGGLSTDRSHPRHHRTSSQPKGPRERHSRASSNSLARPSASHDGEPSHLSPKPTPSPPRTSSQYSQNGNGASLSSEKRQSSRATPPLSPSLSPTLPSPPPIPDSFYQTHTLGRTKSKISIAPSEGEDPDSWHVRSTYAHLEVLGVKGDGYEEGVERTRARLGQSRASELMGESALGSDADKKRELSPQEVEMLASLDR